MADSRSGKHGDTDFHNHRHTGTLPVAPRHSAREATKQILKTGTALGASWPQEEMRFCKQEACALGLPAPGVCCLQPKTPLQHTQLALQPCHLQTDQDQGILCFPLSVPGSLAHTGSPQNQRALGTVLGVSA